ncbi:pimeloyl-ACP methyl ester carboxylesterase [Kineococcus radiotolerans]|uniref:Pimeloyl-ACP methyl ester carboxylesterase n=1 Tax=Kineococcus radiotolerans TaxID=131568 RepID=A0A7W4XX51_KINRA|nr:alpha/beta hydrolase [Kineococcus radiotolerans]MBB2901608.1 pimeloyl-ACP methyl ester carboxylesterase [Kineococcus radiotolerans]
MSAASTHPVEVPLPGGRVLHAHDTGGPGPVVLWHGGTPNTGEPPAPLLEPGVRWIGVDRPGYADSPRRPGRNVASVVGDVVAVLDHLGVERCVSVGHSGGGSHALACAALLPGRVTAALSVSGLAPYDGTPGWFEGLGPAGRASLGAAVAGRAAKEEFQAAGSGGIDFTPEDWALLEGPWGWFGTVVQAATTNGDGGLVDDDLAHVRPWGFDPAGTTVPVHLLHGEADRVVPVGHAHRLAALVPGSTLRVVPGASHLSVLTEAPDALAAVLAHLA